jgi:hypothetical protein
MIDINKEAEEYENKVVYAYKREVYKAFIAGANSEYVQAEKLRFAIESVLEFRKATFGLGNSRLEKLQQQLKKIGK